MILYDTVCTPCIRKELWKKLIQYSAVKHDRLERRNVAYNKQWRSEGDMYGLTYPFIVEDGIAKEVNSL